MIKVKDLFTKADVIKSDGYVYRRKKPKRRYLYITIFILSVVLFVFWWFQGRDQTSEENAPIILKRNIVIERQKSVPETATKTIKAVKKPLKNDNKAKPLDEVLHEYKQQ